MLVFFLFPKRAAEEAMLARLQQEDAVLVHPVGELETRTDSVPVSPAVGTIGDPQNRPDECR